MAKCETCGNDDDKRFEVVQKNRTDLFDRFECAIHALAPACVRCGVRVVGRGTEKNRNIFCRAHCAEQEGVRDLRVRA